MLTYLHTTLLTQKSLILGLLIIALFVTLFTVYIIEKKNEDKDKNILKDSLVISSNVLQEFKDKKPLDQIGFTDKVKNEILANKPSEVVFFLFKQDLDTKILNKIKQLKVKNDALFLTLNLTLDGKTTHEYESILKQFYDAYKQEGEAWDEYKGFNDLTITPYMFKIDSNNLELKDKYLLSDSGYLKFLEILEDNRTKERYNYMCMNFFNKKVKEEPKQEIKEQIRDEVKPEVHDEPQFQSKPQQIKRGNWRSQLINSNFYMN